MATPKILLFRGRGVLSALIRFQTRGQYSHAGVLLPDGRLIEAWQGKGVRITKPKSMDGVHIYDVPGIRPTQWDIVTDFLLREVGAGYDYLGVIRFVSRLSLPDNDRWFCSELVFAAFRAAGVELLSRIDPSEVSPQLLSLSPYLRLV